MSWSSPATAVIVVVALAAAACSAGVDEATLPEPTAPPLTEPAPEPSVAPTDAVQEALGQDVLDDLGLTVDQLCSTVARWTAPETNAIVFMQPDATTAEIEQIATAVRALDPDALYVSQEEAYVEFTEELFADQEWAGEVVTPDLLPPSFRMLVPEETIAELVQSLGAMREVREVIVDRPVFSDEVVAACEG